MDLIIGAAVEYQLWLGRRFDDTADFLDKSSEILRWLAALTRVCA